MRVEVIGKGRGGVSLTTDLNEKMKNRRVIAEALKGKTITRFYRSQQAKVLARDGLGELKWYNLIIEN